MNTVTLGSKVVGQHQPCYVIANIGINHNGDVSLAKRLMSIAMAAGCDAVELRKQSVDLVYSAEELARPRESPFGETEGDLRHALDFTAEEFEELAAFCRSVHMPWLVDVRDPAAVDLMSRFDVVAYKVESSCLSDDHLLRHLRATGKPILASTGLSTEPAIDHAVDVLGKQNLVLLHTTNTFPALYEQLNLRAIAAMRDRYDVPVGYSGHETGIATSVAASALGACCVERHVTPDRALWGAEQAASLEPNGISRMVRDIRLCEHALGDGIKRVYDQQVPAIRRPRHDPAGV